MPRYKPFVRNFYFQAADDSFVRDFSQDKIISKNVESYNYSTPSIFARSQNYDKNAMPIAFRGAPDNLLVLALNVVNTWQLPSVYTWTIEDVCRWLREYGYPQYQNTFRVNLINGRTLLLLDASALSAINVKDFNHMRHIAYGIRCLFHFELTKFGRSISLPSEHYYELYKLFRVKNGPVYDNSIVSNLWRRMQLVRQPEGLREHWETLVRWINFVPDTKPKELFGLTKRYELYECKRKTEKPVQKLQVFKLCNCMPPCECYWTERERRMPWRLEVMGETLGISENRQDISVLSVLYQTFPERYGEHKIRYNSGCK